MQMYDSDQEYKGSGFFKIKDEMLLTVGVILIILGVFFAIGSVVIYVDESAENRESSWLLVVCCTVPFFIMATLLMRKGFEWRREQAELENLVQYVKTRGEITIEELAQVMYLGRMEVTNMLQKAREKKFIRGVFKENGTVFMCTSRK